MRTRWRSGGWIGGAFMLALMTGCAASRRPEAPKPPDWVMQGSGAYTVSGARMFQGVGVGQGIRDREEAAAKAGSRAQEELAKALSDYISVFSKGVFVDPADGGGNRKGEESGRSWTQSLKEFSKDCMAGAVVESYWHDPADDSTYALARLDLGSVRKRMRESRDLSQKVRESLLKNADTAFEELSLESARR